MVSVKDAIQVQQLTSLIDSEKLPSNSNSNSNEKSISNNSSSSSGQNPTALGQASSSTSSSSSPTPQTLSHESGERIENLRKTCSEAEQEFHLEEDVEFKNICQEINDNLTDKSLNDSSSFGYNSPKKESIEERANISSLDDETVELRFLVRRREAGALIGKRGSNIKRLRETFKLSIFSIPDTGNGPERVVCIVTNEKSLSAILTDLTELLREKSPENDEQIELKLLIHSSHAGSIIGIGGQSIKKLRNESKAAIKIYEMCCPLSNERVCAIKAKPPVVVNTIKLIRTILFENPIKGTVKPYDALNFDLNSIDKYGGYFPEDLSNQSSQPLIGNGQINYHYQPALNHQHHQLTSQFSTSNLRSTAHQANVNSMALAAAAVNASRNCQLWRTPEFYQQQHEQQLSACIHQHQQAVAADELEQSEVRKEAALALKINQALNSSPFDQQLLSPVSRIASRFHPYATPVQLINRYIHPSHLHQARLGQQVFPRAHNPRFAPRAPYQRQQQAQAARHFANFQTRYNRPSDGLGPNHSACRHSRPCLCVLMPAMAAGKHKDSPTINNHKLQQQNLNLAPDAGPHEGATNDNQTTKTDSLNTSENS